MCNATLMLTLKFWIKCADNYWMDLYEMWFTHSRPPQEELQPVIPLLFILRHIRPGSYPPVHVPQCPGSWGENLLTLSLDFQSPYRCQRLLLS